MALAVKSLTPSNHFLAPLLAPTAPLAVTHLYADDRLAALPRPLVVYLDGPHGSGKHDMLKRLASLVPPSTPP